MRGRGEHGESVRALRRAPGIQARSDRCDVVLGIDAGIDVEPLTLPLGYSSQPDGSHE